MTKAPLAIIWMLFGRPQFDGKSPWILLAFSPSLALRSSSKIKTWRARLLGWPKSMQHLKSYALQGTLDTYSGAQGNLDE